MDPQTTWEEMLEALAAEDFDAASEAAAALDRWLQRGGFPPQPLTRVLSDYWNRKICQFVCGQVFEAICNREINR